HVRVRETRRHPRRRLAPVGHAPPGADDQVWLTPGGDIPQRPTRVLARARAARRAPARLPRPGRHETAAAARSEQAEGVEEAHPHSAYQQPLTGLDPVEV